MMKLLDVIDVTKKMNPTNEQATNDNIMVTTIFFKNMNHKR